MPNPRSVITWTTHRGALVRSRVAPLLLAATVWSLGCGVDEPSPDSQSNDSQTDVVGGGLDAVDVSAGSDTGISGLSDGGRGNDSGASDSGAPDSGTLESGTADSYSADTDSNTLDSVDSTVDADVSEPPGDVASNDAEQQPDGDDAKQADVPPSDAADAGFADAADGGDPDGTADTKAGCAGPADCDDANACTIDTCAGPSGCAHKAVPDALPCDIASASCAAAAACVAGACVATSPKLFTTSYTGKTGRAIAAVAELAGGDLALAGSSGVSGSAFAGLPIGGDYWLTRVSADGTALWTQEYGGTGSDRCHAVVALADGSLVMVGSTTSPSLPGGAVVVGDSDAWVVRTSATGKLISSRTLGGNGTEFVLAALGTPDGGLAVAVITTSTTLPGGGGTAGMEDFWLVFTDANGKPGKSATYGGPGTDFVTAIVAMPAGGYALAGMQATGTPKPGAQEAGLYDAYVVRTDGVGKQLWAHTYGGSSGDEAWAVSPLPDGGLLVAGETESTDIVGGGKAVGGYDAWVFATTGDGTLKWSRTFGGAGADYAYTIIPRPAGDFAVVGSMSSAAPTLGVGSSGGFDMWSLRIGLQGQLVDSQAFGGTDDERSFRAIGLQDGGIAYVGERQTASGSTKYDGWLVRTDPWSNDTCAQSGPCADMAAAGCDDANPCTADLCDAAHGGCWSTPYANGSACGAGVTCQQATCQ